MSTNNPMDTSSPRNFMEDSEEESRIKALIVKREREEADTILTLRMIRGEIEELRRKLEKGERGESGATIDTFV